MIEDLLIFQNIMIEQFVTLWMNYIMINEDKLLIDANLLLWTWLDEFEELLTPRSKAY